MSAAQEVYACMTADYAMGRRHGDLQCDLVLDFDGFLHVDDVDRFVDALRAWRDHVRRQGASRLTRRDTRAAIVAHAERVNAVFAKDE